MTEATTVRLDKLHDFDAGRLVPDQQHRLDVVTDHCTIPLLVVPRSGAERLVVLNNGAVDQERAGGAPVFQRSSWSEEIRHHQIYVYDPATGAPDFLSLGWGQVSSETWAAFPIGRAVRILAERLGVTAPQDRTYFGSSAGGFMALALLADDPGARAVVNNAQFDWTRWMATGVNPLRQARYNNMLPVHLRARHPLRTNVLHLFIKRHHPLRIDYHVNSSSEHDHQVDRPMLEDFIRSHSSLTLGVRILPYENPEAGHNPLPKEQTLRILHSRSAVDR